MRQKATIIFASTTLLAATGLFIATWLPKVIEIYEVPVFRYTAAALFMLATFLLMVPVNRLKVKRQLMAAGTAFSALVISGFLCLQLWQHLQYQAVYERVAKMQDVEAQFALDLENDELKWFTFGIGFDHDYANELRRAYGLDTWHMGCLVEGRYEAYNELVKKHLATKGPIALLE